MWIRISKELTCNVVTGRIGHIDGLRVCVFAIDQLHKVVSELLNVNMY